MPDNVTPEYQYKRNFSLAVTDSSQNSIDLSGLHCKFAIKRSSNMTPNGADIRIYNLSSETAQQISQNFAPSYQAIPGTTTLKITGKPGTVVLNAGYDSNNGVIFRGNIRQVIVGRESATDTFLDLNCGDGAIAYNYGLVRTAVRATGQSLTQNAIFNQIAQPMYGLGLTLGTDQPKFLSGALPRGKTMWGSSRDYLRIHAQQNDLTWSIQDEQIQFIKQQGYAPGESVILTSKTGMIGTPQQTNWGVNVVCLLNPKINPGQTIKIDNASVAQMKLDLANSKDPANLPPPLNLDGVYYVLVIETTGDTRGIDWYTKLICGIVDPSTNPYNSVGGNYGP